MTEGPQTRPFSRALLEKGVAEESKAATCTPTSHTEFDSIGFGADGDRQLVEVILEFSRSLLENCGNRSLYSSSERLGDLLNTTSLSLLSTTLQLAVRLAQRYHASRQRGANASQYLNNTLLGSHYNIDLEKVQKLANPFVQPQVMNLTSASAITPSLKGKENAPDSEQALVAINANDMLALAEGAPTAASRNGKTVPSYEQKPVHRSRWEDWGGVLLTYYQSSPTTREGPKPTTPTPTRRASNLSRASRLSNSDEHTDVAIMATNPKSDEVAVGGMRQLEIPQSQILSSSTEELLLETLESLPKDSRFELLTKVRVAHAMANSDSTRQQLLGIRLLAITNLAYIYPEATFQQKILQQDSDEARNLQLAQQLTNLINPPGNRAAGIPPMLQVFALGTLEALSKHKSKAPEICAALNVNVNHGILFHLLRRAVAQMGTEDSNEEDAENEEWRDAVFSLLDALPASAPRTGESLVGAGLLDLLIEVLNLRTSKAERNHPKVLTFLNSIIYMVRDAFQTLANSKGLETISGLIAYEVQSSKERAEKGEGLPEGFRTRVTDYQIPFFQQQTLRMLFKIINHMMTHSPGNFDRLLRNLIDSPQLLSGVRTVITNAKVFGSSVWSAALNIMSNFIHNEPTSYAIISEAGLSKGLLESISAEPLMVETEKKTTEDSSTTTERTDSQSPQRATVIPSGPSNGADPVFTLQRANDSATGRALLAKTYTHPRSPNYVLASGILPATDAIVAVPHALGAICLNHSGMDMFLNRSRALDSFFEIFESQDHVRSMRLEEDLLRLLGNSFDELVRHHPDLRGPVLAAIMNMLKRVGFLSESLSTKADSGARLWVQAADGQPTPAGKDSTLAKVVFEGPQKQSDDDVVMEEASATIQPTPSLMVSQSGTSTSSTKDGKKALNASAYIEVAMKFLGGFFEASTTPLCSMFVEHGGAEDLIKMSLLPKLEYDFNNQQASSDIARVLHMLAEQKPHLVLPSLLQNLQQAVNRLQPLYNHTGEDSFFAEFTTSGSSTETSKAAIGSIISVALVQVHTLCKILHEIFTTPIYNTRSTHTPFSQVNLADVYANIVKSLGLLHRVCVWEEILLQKQIPKKWKEATRVKGIGMGSQEADEIFGFLGIDNQSQIDANDEPSLASDINGDAGPSRDTGSSVYSKTFKNEFSQQDEKLPQFKNIRTLHYLLTQIPSRIVLFYEGLGKALVAKRRPETYARQNAYRVAEAMSDANMDQLSYEIPRNAASAEDRYRYWTVVLTSISQLMFEGTRIL